MSGICEGRVAIVTGAGRGLGRAHALELGREGASVVVNDLGVELDGSGGGPDWANEVAAEIRAHGGHAVVDNSDIPDWAGAQAVVESALRAFGRLDVLVNNAGVLRDRMIISLTADDVTKVVGVHLCGALFTSHHAGRYWREQAKAGETPDARIINTTSGAGLYGNVGQSAYSAAKAGIVGLTLVGAAELARYGVTVNALSPGARTRMTQEVFASAMAEAGDGFDAMAPENVSPLVAWLASPASGSVTGRVFESYGGMLGIAEGFHHGPSVTESRRLAPAEVGDVVHELLRQAAPPEPVQGS